MSLPNALSDLRDERVWVAWDDEDGRKVPKSPRGGNARSNDPSTWGTYAEAEAVRARNGYSGVGLMLTDGYIGIDLDGVIEDGELADWARDIVESFGSYAEVSPSGTGVHVIAWADPEQVGAVGRNNRRDGIEIYNHGRYFTVTGERITGDGVRDITGDVADFISRWFRGESPEEAVRRRVGDLASAQVKRMANRTMTRNAMRDGVRYARVPTGSETCGWCLMLASRGFVYASEATAGGDRPDHYHAGCVLPDTVLGAIGVKSLLRRKFEGDVIDITTRGGRHLSVTANHPILTVNGWVKAGMLHDGDALLCGFTGKGHDFGVPSVDDRPPSAEQVFEALRLLDAAYPVGVEVSSADFDGEPVSNSDVEVIDVNRLLEGHIVPVGHESFGDESFSVGALFERCKRLNGAGAANFGDGTHSLPSCGVMRGLGLCSPVLRGHLGGADETGLGTAAPMDTSVVEPTVNDMPGDAVSLGQLQDALSALVSLDEIGRCGDSARAYLDSIAFEDSEGLLVRDSKLFGNGFDALPSGIEVDYVSVADTRHFVGHVYNLSADGHWYTANGIITHNCDCKIMPEFGDIEVEGYDPDALYDVYSEAYGDLDGRAGLRRMWEELPDESRARRIDRRDGDEGAAFDAYCEEQIAKRIELKLTGSTRDAT